MTGSQFWLQSRRKSPMLPHHQGACMGRKENLLKGLQERPEDAIAKTIRSFQINRAAAIHSPLTSDQLKGMR
jgi:hypothetical protein